MANIHHKPIKRFSLSGNIHDEAALWRLRVEYRKLLETEMRLSGYVPRIDINQDFTVDYNYEKKYFEFELSIYAIYVGKKKSEWIAGVDETKVIYTQVSKSSELSQEAA
jgi:hypothetical protein